MPASSRPEPQLPDTLGSCARYACRSGPLPARHPARRARRRGDRRRAACRPRRWSSPRRRPSARPPRRRRSPLPGVVLGRHLGDLGTLRRGEREHRVGRGREVDLGEADRGDGLRPVAGEHLHLQGHVLGPVDGDPDAAEQRAGLLGCQDQLVRRAPGHCRVGRDVDLRGRSDRGQEAGGSLLWRLGGVGRCRVVPLARSVGSTVAWVTALSLLDQVHTSEPLRITELSARSPSRATFDLSGPAYATRSVCVPEIREEKSAPCSPMPGRAGMPRSADCCTVPENPSGSACCRSTSSCSALRGGSFSSAEALPATRVWRRWRGRQRRARATAATVEWAWGHCDAEPPESEGSADSPVIGLTSGVSVSSRYYPRRLRPLVHQRPDVEHEVTRTLPGPAG